MRRWLSGVLLLITLLTSGCWDRTEVNDLAIVNMVALDRAKEGIRLTVSIVNPPKARPTGGDGQGGQGKPVVVYSAVGTSIMEAQTRIQEQASRRLFWAHTRVLVFGEDLARAGVSPVIDFWSRHREPRLTILVAVTPGQAADLLRVQPGVERLLSEAIRETINMELQTRTTLCRFLNTLRTSGSSPMAPRVLLVRDEQGRQDILVSGSAVFKKDRLVGWLTDRETRGVLWLRGESRSGVVTVQPPGGGKISMQLIRARTQIRPAYKGGRLRISVHAVLDDDVYENGTSLDLGNPETLRLVESLLAQAVRNRALAALQRVQSDYKTDVLRFGEVVARHLPALWENGLERRWAEEFPRVPVDVTVLAHVRRTGGHGAPLGMPQKDVKKAESGEGGNE